MPHTLREPWLAQAVADLTPLFAAAELELPKAVRISVGFPGGRNKKSTTIGQCWASSASEDKLHQIFIHPGLNDPETILGVIIHELVHAIDDCENQHKGPFTKMIRALGLEGKPTATVVGEELAQRLTPVLAGLGEYPHSILGSLGAPNSGPKPQKNRQMKVQCATSGYIARTTRSWLDLYGPPLCPCCQEVMEEARPEQPA